MMQNNKENQIPVKYKGFLLRKENKVLVLNSTNFIGAIKVMKSDGISHLEINSNYFPEESLDFIEQFEFIDGLTLLTPFIKDISPIQYLKNLKILRIEHKFKGELDFSKFPNLTDCFFCWGIKGSDTIFHSKSLQSLQIDKYSNYEILPIVNLPALKRISLFNSRLVNLMGIRDLPCLENLDLSGSNKLEDIEGIGNLSLIKILRLDYCKKITELKEIGRMSQLISLAFNNVGKIDSIKSFSSLKEMKEIFFTEDVNIVDGDLRSLHFLCDQGKLKQVIFRNRRHYTHTRENLGYKVPNVVANIFKKK